MAKQGLQSLYHKKAGIPTKNLKFSKLKKFPLTITRKASFVNYLGELLPPERGDMSPYAYYITLFIIKATYDRIDIFYVIFKVNRSPASNLGQPMRIGLP
jgi:hypothetical protein